MEAPANAADDLMDIWCDIYELLWAEATLFLIIGIVCAVSLLVLLSINRDDDSMSWLLIRLGSVS